MATTNPFDLLGDSENDDLSLLIAAQQKKLVARPPAATSPTAAKLPSKPLPPAQAVREARNNAATIREGTGRGGSGRSGRGAGTGQNRDFDNGNYTRYGGGRGGLSVENGDVGDLSERGRGSTGQYRGSFRGGRRGGYVSGSGEGGLDPDRPQRRVYERRSGTGIGYDMKKEGAGRGNWGTVTDEVHAQETEESVIVDEKVETPEKQVEQNDGNVADASKDKKEEAAHEAEKEPEDNEMTLEEYEKIREEKRKALLSLKVEERRVEIDKELQSMQQLALKKGNDEVFIKLSSSDKDSPKLRDNAEKEERIKKAVNIHEFLKPAEGGRYYNPSGRGRGRGGRGGDREPFRGAYTGGASIPPVIPSIEDQGQFPALGAK